MKLKNVYEIFYGAELETHQWRQILKTRWSRYYFWKELKPIVDSIG